MTEDEFERAIVDLATLFGWFAVGHRPARTNQGWRTPFKYDGKGWPDLTLLHPERGLVVLAEVKLVAGRLSPDQKRWAERLSQLSSNAASVEYALWRPEAAGEIGRLLSFGRVADWKV